MDMEMIKAAKEKTIHHLVDKIDDICHEAHEDGKMSDEDVKTIAKAWKTIWTAMQVCKELH